MKVRNLYIGAVIALMLRVLLVLWSVKRAIIESSSTWVKRVSQWFLIHSIKVHAGKISTTDLVNKVFTFCELYSGVVFYPYQTQFSKRVIRSIIENDGAEITALFSRQSGKSETIATTVGGCMIILPQLANMPMFLNDTRLQMFTDGLWVGIFAPSERQAKITYNRMRKRLQSKNAIAVLTDPDFRLQFSCSNGQTVALTNGSFATAISASEGSNIEGESFKFIICEEAQDISNFKIRKSIHPMGASYNSTIVKIGTATTFVGDFYEAIERNKKDYDNGTSSIRNHFEYDCDVVMKYNPKYAQYVTKEKYRLGEDSDEFQMSYKLKWIISRGMFVDMSIVERNNGVDCQRVPYDKELTHVAGIDVASKNDSTVITIVEVDWENPVLFEERYTEDLENVSYTAYMTHIKDWIEFHGDDYEEQYPKILEFLGNYNIKKVVIDATREASLAHRLRANLPCEVTPYVFSTKSKSEMWKHLDREIKAQRATFPASEEVRKTREYMKFYEQMSDLQKGYNGQHMVCEHPKEKDAHDDYCDSWGLAVLGSKEEGDSLTIETSNNNKFYDKSGANQFYGGRNQITARRRR